MLQLVDVERRGGPPVVGEVDLHAVTLGDVQHQGVRRRPARRRGEDVLLLGGGDEGRAHTGGTLHVDGADGELLDRCARRAQPVRTVGLVYRRGVGRDAPVGQWRERRVGLAEHPDHAPGALLEPAGNAVHVQEVARLVDHLAVGAARVAFVHPACAGAAVEDEREPLRRAEMERRERRLRDVAAAVEQPILDEESMAVDMECVDVGRHVDRTDDERVTGIGLRQRRERVTLRRQRAEHLARVGIAVGQRLGAHVERGVDERVAVDLPEDELAEAAGEVPGNELGRPDTAVVGVEGGGVVGARGRVAGERRRRLRVDADGGDRVGRCERPDRLAVLEAPVLHTLADGAPVRRAPRLDDDLPDRAVGPCVGAVGVVVEEDVVRRLVQVPAALDELGAGELVAPVRPDEAVHQRAGEACRVTAGDGLDLVDLDAVSALADGDPDPVVQLGLLALRGCEMEDGGSGGGRLGELVVGDLVRPDGHLVVEPDDGAVGARRVELDVVDVQVALGEPGEAHAVHTADGDGDGRLVRLLVGQRQGDAVVDVAAQGQG